VFRLSGATVAGQRATIIASEPVPPRPLVAFQPKAVSAMAALSSVARRDPPSPAPMLRPPRSGAAVPDEADWESF